MRLEFRPNLSPGDRSVRALIGFFLIGLVYVGFIGGRLAVLAVAFAVLMLMEAVFGY